MSLYVITHLGCGHCFFFIKDTLPFLRMNTEETELDFIHLAREEEYPEWIPNTFTGWSLPVVLLRIQNKNICIRSGPSGWSTETIDIWVNMCISLLKDNGLSKNNDTNDNNTNDTNDNDSSSSCDECTVNVNVLKPIFVGDIVASFRAPTRIDFKFLT